MSKWSFGSTKSLLHFEVLLRDDIGIETWEKQGTSVTQCSTAKFGKYSLDPASGALIGTNTSGIWNINSSGNYEIEFFVYPVKNNIDTRYLFQLTTTSEDTVIYILRLYLTSGGQIRLLCDDWGYPSGSTVTGTTVLKVSAWHHVMLRIINETAKVFVDGVEEISADLPENVVLQPEKARIGYYSKPTAGAAIYIDEFVFRHSAGTETPTVPTSCYLPYVGDFVSKRDFGTIKSILHFDYPYFNEPNDGLDDDVGIETWHATNSNVKMYGNAIPNAGTFTPKFGYRCLYSYKGSVSGTNTSGIWNLNSSGNYEIAFFVNYPVNGSSTKYLFRLREEGTTILALSINDSGYLELIATGWEITEAISGTTSITSNMWQHVLMRVSGETLRVYIDGEEDISVELPENVTLQVSEVRLGYFSSTSYPFYMDEFVFRHSSGSGKPVIPEHPYNATLDVSKIGGYGTGQDGEKVIRADAQINSYGAISTVTNSKTFTVSEWSNGDCEPSTGTEVMIHITSPRSTVITGYPEVGLYTFSRIASIDGTSVELADEITEDEGYDFTLSSELITEYCVQIITVPNYNNLVISSGATVIPLTWNSTKGGGIVVFRVKGSCMLHGSILVHGKGAIRYDLHQMTHSKLIDRFLCSQGGGVYITCGGRFAAASNARIGSYWGGYGISIYHGAAGYGGKGGSVRVSSATNNQTGGGAGGVGGGGGGCYYYTSYYTGAKAGSNTTTGSQGGGGGCNGSVDRQ